MSISNTLIYTPVASEEMLLWFNAKFGLNALNWNGLKPLEWLVFNAAVLCSHLALPNVQSASVFLSVMSSSVIKPVRY